MKVNISITVEESVVKAVDRAAKKLRQSRSRIFEVCAMEHFKDQLGAGAWALGLDGLDNGTEGGAR